MWWPTAAESVSAGDTLGLFLIAAFIAILLYGITILQTLQYFDRFYNDSRLSKLLVSLLWLFETLTSVMIVHAVYTYAVTHRSDDFATLRLPTSFGFEAAFYFATVYVAQIFFAWRMHHLGRQYWFLPAITALLATAAIATGLAATVESGKYGVNTTHPVFPNVLLAVSVGLQIAADVIITVSLYWLNRKSRGDPDGNMLKVSFLSAVNRGVFSVLLLVLTTITYFALRPKLTWLVFHFASSKMHVISMLSTLNGRTSRDGLGHDPEIVDAMLRYRLKKELGSDTYQTRLDSPPNLPSIAHGLPSSPSGWFASGKSNEGCSESYTPSYHARSTTAVDGASG
ncbi:hypothetical protein L227DRAFT_573594 [Lentinus tigrinus ALCF2SS1-6]|uniref:DUF6534 domain-containing protein n=1 Tax=Lentinus tigrinus ALCF2SS1-6 TaxID=1328759 RepID=A0A5C2SGR3_9APHY|nr:hypothetical protein L227DRAFT_573594 [Lentinus tigrinus ALCF2SS1-6]